jgi:hypothetical protein
VVDFTDVAHCPEDLLASEKMEALLESMESLRGSSLSMLALCPDRQILEVAFMPNTLGFLVFLLMLLVLLLFQMFLDMNLLGSLVFFALFGLVSRVLGTFLAYPLLHSLHNLHEMHHVIATKANRGCEYMLLHVGISKAPFETSLPAHRQPWFVTI